MSECETNDLNDSSFIRPLEQRASLDPRGPFEQLHPNSIVVERWGGLIFLSILSFIGLVVWGALTIFVFPPWDLRCWLIGLSGFTLLTLLGYIVRMDPVWRFRSTRFRELPGGLELQRGYVWWHRIFVPRERIQHTDVVQGPLMRRFNVATLVINTAGTHDHAISIEGIDFVRAEQLRASLLIKIADASTPQLIKDPRETDFVSAIHDHDGSVQSPIINVSSTDTPEPKPEATVSSESGVEEDKDANSA